MSKLSDYINKTKKTDIIFNFDKTLFKVLLDWDNYFGEILNDLLKINRDL